MDSKTVYFYIFVMALVTYLIRFIPLTFFRKKITSPRIKAFLNFVPFSVLGAMTIPDVFYSTGNTMSATIGLGLAIFLSIKGKDMLSVTIITCLVVFIIELMIR